MKKLLLTFGFILFVVSCGGGSVPTPTSTPSNWHKHQPGEWVWIDWPDGVPASWSDKITPDNIGTVTYRSHDGTTLGTAPSVGDTGMFTYFVDVAYYCLNSDPFNVCDSNNKIWNPLQTDEADFLMCETSSWYSWVDLATAKQDAIWSCGIYRYYGNDLIQLSGEQLGNGGWECMAFADSNDPTTQTMTAPYYIMGGIGACSNSSRDLGAHIQHSRIATYSIGQQSADEHVFFAWGTCSSCCDEQPSFSKEFGPLAILGLWSWAGDFNHNGSPIACPIGPSGPWALPDWEDTNPDTSTHP